MLEQPEQVKEFVKDDQLINIIYVTYDYSKFQINKKNRKIKNANVNKILRSLGIKILLASYPIMTDYAGFILDGQNRFTAAKERGLPIYYFMQNEVSIADIAHCSESTTPWTPDDYLEFYFKLDVKSYIDIYYLIQKYPFLRCQSVLYLGGGTRSELRKEFKQGTYDFTPEREKKVIEIYEWAILINKKLTVQLKDEKTDKTTIIPPKFNCFAFIFLSAIKKIIDAYGFSDKIFARKIDLYSAMLTKGITEKDYISILQELYNYMEKKELPNNRIDVTITKESKVKK